MPLRFLPLCVLFACTPDLFLDTDVAEEQIDREEESRAFERWTKGGPRDQGKIRPEEHSLLVAHGGGLVEDIHLAKWARPALATSPVIWVFAQCFGGGMFDELVAEGGVQSMASASRHDEPSHYRRPAPGGIGVDWLDAYIDSLGPVTLARLAARLAGLEDPFGINPRAARMGEPMGSEHPQYFETKGAGKLTLSGKKGAVAILWSGQPHLYDTEQIDEAIVKLQAAGYTRDRILVLFGSGRLGPTHTLVVNHMAGVVPPIKLRAATGRQLKMAIASAFPEGVKRGQLFFLANDHGARRAGGLVTSIPRTTAPGDQDNPLDEDASEEGGEYGRGDDDQPPEWPAPNAVR